MPTRREMKPITYRACLMDTTNNTIQAMTRYTQSQESFEKHKHFLMVLLQGGPQITVNILNTFMCWKLTEEISNKVSYFSQQENIKPRTHVL